MEIYLGIVGIIVLYLVITGSRNRDPLNRKCAAEICEYLVTNSAHDPYAIRDIFMRNARYQKQATHVVSMVPALLIMNGIPRAAAMAVVPVLRSGAAMVPQ